MRPTRRGALLEPRNAIREYNPNDLLHAGPDRAKEGIGFAARTKGIVRPNYSRGDVQLYKGDAVDVLRTLPDSSVDFVFTDPPYGTNTVKGLVSHWKQATGRAKPGDKVERRVLRNDGGEANPIVYYSFWQIARVLKPGGCCCCCCAGGGGKDIKLTRWSDWMAEFLKFKQIVVWDKGPMGLGWHYRRSYEVILVAQKGGAACRWYDTSYRIENVIRDIRKVHRRSGDHPTPKPVELVRKFLGLHTRKGDTVLDPFMGGGTTGVACVQTGRKFIGAEIEPAYYRMASKRIRAAKKDVKKVRRRSA